MRALLGEKGYEVAYQESHVGHNYYGWRDDLAAGLEYLFGGA
jgi:enterochelin esterase-like enzyme